VLNGIEKKTMTHLNISHILLLKGRVGSKSDGIGHCEPSGRPGFKRHRKRHRVKEREATSEREDNSQKRDDNSQEMQHG